MFSLKPSVRGNIPRSILFTFLSRISLSESVWMLFLAFRGMSLVQIGLLESIFHITSMLMEIPTGIVADRFGRKTSRILGRVAAMISGVMMLSANSFWGFAAAFVLTALSYNLESGAGDAMVYDSLVELKDEGRFMKVKGVLELAFQSASMVSLIVGGIVATYSYFWAYAISVGLHVLSLGVALTFKEPKVGRPEVATAVPERNKITLFRHIQESIRVIRENHGILKYVLYIEGFSLFCTTLYFWFQNHLKSTGYVEWQIGLVLAIATAASAVAGMQADRLERKIGENRTVRTVPFFAVAALALIAWSPWEPLGMVLLLAIDSLLVVSFSGYINRMIPSHCRATLLSFQSMVFSVLMIVLFPIVGLVAEHWGFKTAFRMIFAVSLVWLAAVRFSFAAERGKMEQNGVEEAEGLASTMDEPDEPDVPA